MLGRHIELKETTRAKETAQGSIESSAAEKLLALCEPSDKAELSAVKNGRFLAFFSNRPMHSAERLFLSVVSRLVLWPKFQAPSSNMQRSFKTQSPNPAVGIGVIGFCFFPGSWWLEVGALIPGRD